AFTASNASAGSGPNTHDGLWMPNFIRITLRPGPETVRAAMQRRPAQCPTVLCGSDPDGLYIQILFHLLDARLAAVTTHLVAAERHGRIHRLIAVDPH